MPTGCEGSERVRRHAMQDSGGVRYFTWDKSGMNLLEIAKSDGTLTKLKPSLPGDSRKGARVERARADVDPRFEEAREIEYITESKPDGSFSYSLYLPNGRKK